MQQKINQFAADTSAAASDGFTDIFAAHLAMFDAFENAVNNEPDAGVCASVTMRINQDVVMQRQGFLATLEINNGGSTPMTNLTVTVLAFRHSDAELVTQQFAIGDPTLTSLDSVSGGSLAGGATGSAQWLIIPFSTAVPTDQPMLFDIGGTMEYELDGESIAVPLFPATITVHPDPQVAVNYFLEQVCNYLLLLVCVCVCVCVCVWVWVCVCVCVCFGCFSLYFQRERERERECVCVCV